MSSLKITNDKNSLVVELNRPDIHNAFNAEMIEELTQTFLNIPNGVRAILLKGAGKSFCAGGDLNWMKAMARFSREENLKDSEKLFEMFEAIYRAPVPVIAKVHGNIFGGGLGLLAACDVVAAVRESKYCFSEAKLGLVPAVISAFVLKKSSPMLARQMMLTAQIFDENKAQEMGLVNFIGSDEEVEDFVQSQIEFFKSNGADALKDTKYLLDFVPMNTWDAIKKETTRVIAERRVSQEGQEGMKAFFEKRKPTWKS